MDELCKFGDKKNAKQELEGAFKGYRDMEEIHYGGEGPHWAVVPKKKKKKTKKNISVKTEGASIA